jgi:hypothetical protein
VERELLEREPLERELVERELVERELLERRGGTHIFHWIETSIFQDSSPYYDIKTFLILKI